MAWEPKQPWQPDRSWKAREKWDAEPAAVQDSGAPQQSVAAEPTAPLPVEVGPRVEPEIEVTYESPDDPIPSTWRPDPTEHSSIDIATPVIPSNYRQPPAAPTRYPRSKKRTNWGWLWAVAVAGYVLLKTQSG